MTTKGCNKFAKPQNKLSLRSVLSTTARAILLSTPIWAVPVLAATTSNFTGDFEQGSFSGWNQQLCCKHSGTVVTSPVRAGKYAAKFTLKKSDHEDHHRAELATKPVPANSERWYGFSIMLPSDYKKDQMEEILTQWHSMPDKELGEKPGAPPLFLMTENGNWQLGRRWDANKLTAFRAPQGSEGINLGAYEPGVWTDFVFHIKWSYQSDGLIEVWKNGKLVLTKTGPNTYNDQLGPYLKVGIYKAGWGVAKRTSSTTERTIYIDEVRIGDANSNYASIAPKAVLVK